MIDSITFQEWRVEGRKVKARRMQGKNSHNSYSIKPRSVTYGVHPHGWEAHQDAWGWRPKNQIIIIILQIIIIITIILQFM
jgi:hypothetical protein